MSEKSSGSRSTFLRRRWLVGAVLVAVAAALWLVHPIVLAHAEKAILTYLASRSGLKLEVGSIHSNLTRPIKFYDLKLRAANGISSQTAIDIESVEISLNWPWEMVFGSGRVFRVLTVEGLRGIFDGRPPHLESAKAGDAGAAEPAPKSADATTAASIRYLPQALVLRRSSMEFLADGQSYYLDDVSADFNESQLGKLHAAGAEIRIGHLRQSFGSLDGVTAWKEGAAYLADVSLLEGVTLENFRVDFTQPGGPALDFEAGTFGGHLQANVTFSRHAAIDAAVWASDVRLDKLSAVLGLQASMEGLLREARCTFRGSPSRLLESEASFRVSADGFRWNQRGWQSLTIGANLIHSRVVVSEFRLKQKDNSVVGNGEISLAKGWRGLARSPFSLNGTASIQDLGALAGLVGPPFDEMSGRMSVSGSINGNAGKLEGYLSAEASDMKFRNRAVDAANLDVVFANADAQIERCEVWSENDYLRARGTVGVFLPHAYNGEIQARAKDIAAYTQLFPSIHVPVVSSGALQVRWQGDGNRSAHSGAFNAALDAFVSEQTPSGLTGRFAGTYSPQNIYFSGFELEQGPLRLSTRATLAASGIVLQDGVLRSGTKEIATANVFLPLNPFDALGGKPWVETVNPDREVYLSATTSEGVGLRDLSRLIGRGGPWQGSVKFDVHASGLPSALVAKAGISTRDVSLRLDKSSDAPLSQLDLLLEAAGGTAKVTGSLQAPKFPAAALRLELPFGVSKGANGALAWGSPQGHVTGRLDVPQLPLSVAAPYLPGLRGWDGAVTGSFTVDGTQSQPAFQGAGSLADGRSAGWPLLSRLAVGLRADGSKFTIENAGGYLGTGAFTFGGTVSTADFWRPRTEFTASGRDVTLLDNSALRLRADFDLQGSGDKNSGSVKGQVNVTDLRVSKRLQITMMSAPASAAGLVALSPPHLFPAGPFGRWKLDLAVSNEAPVVSFGSQLSKISSDIRFLGTVARPLPAGRLAIQNVPAFLPFTRLTIQSGHLDFFENSPWEPRLDLYATARALDYDVQLYAFGPLSERRAILRSDPPLPQQALSMLLASGLAPGVYTPRLTSPVSVPGKPTFAALQPSSTYLVAPFAVGGQPERVRLWEGLLHRSDDLGLSGQAATYDFRFR